MDLWDTSSRTSSFVPVSAVSLPSQHVLPSHDVVKTLVRAASTTGGFVRLPSVPSTRLNSRGAHLIVSHGCTLNAFFTLPTETRLVYLVPPSCDMAVSSQATLLRTPGVLDQILRFEGPTSFRVRSKEYFVQRYGPGDRVLDQLLTFAHDTGHAGVFRLPLHPNVVAGSFGQSLASARVVGAASNHELTKLTYTREHANAFLSEYLRFLGPGTYVIAACRGSCDDRVTTNIQRRFGSQSPISLERNAWASTRRGALPNMTSGTILHANAMRVLLNTTTSNSDSNYESNSERRAKRPPKRPLWPTESPRKNRRLDISVYGPEAVRTRVLQRQGRRKILGEIQQYFGVVAPSPPPPLLLSERSNGRPSTARSPPPWSPHSFSKLKSDS